MDVKAMDVIEAVKNIIEKTKKQVQEEERKEKLIKKFEEIFGFRPTSTISITWNANWNLKAMYVVNLKTIDNKDFDDLIEGKKVIEIAFKLWEESKDVGYDLDWKFSTTKGIGANYYWIRRYGQYTACIEIITLN